MEVNKTTRGDILNIDPRNVVIVEGFNSRRDFDLDTLKDQIKAQGGVLNPISVIPFKDENGNEKYRLVDGERRVRATLALLEEGYDGVARIPANKLSKALNDSDLLIQQLVRNEGKRFSEYEYAIAFAKMRDNSKFTLTEIAEKVFGNANKVNFVSLCLAHLELPMEVQEKLASGEISATTVRDITRVAKDDEQMQVKAVNEAVKTAKEKGKKTATTKDISTEYVKVQTDSMAICKGLGILFKYIEKYSEKGQEVNINLVDMYEKLQNKEAITDILDNMSKTVEEEVVYSEAE